MSADRDAEQAIALHAAGRIEEAAALCRAILARGDEQPRALHLLGVISSMLGRREEALDLLQRAVAAKPDYAEAHFNLGALRAEIGDLRLAAGHYKRAAELRPDNPWYWRRLGAASMDLQDYTEAEAAFRAVLRLHSDDAVALTDLAYVVYRRGRLDEAVDLGRRAVALAPELKVAHRRLCRALADRGDLDGAAPEFAAAVAAEPAAGAWLGVAELWSEAGLATKATSALRRALELEPDDPQLHRALICAHPLDSGVTPSEMAAARRAWAERFAEPLTAGAVAHLNSRDPDRRLRIGYVAAGTCRYNTGAMVLLPILEAHDPAAFAVYCYSDVSHDQEDVVTARFRRASTYRESSGLTDEQLSDRIRSDQIDILVDPFGFPEGSRLLAFARKPAPLQVCFPTMGSPQMSAIDYTIGDPHVIPSAMHSEFRERVIDVPVAYAFSCLADVPPVQLTPPLAANGYVTFGSFNRLSRVNDPVLAAWSRILGEISTARLVIKPGRVSDATLRWFRHRLARAGLDEARIDILPPVATATEHLSAYNHIDIALDPFPYGGVTISCEALLMGVPVVTYASDRVLGRYTASFLTAVQLADLVSLSADDYVATAVRLARHPHRLYQLRRDLHARFAASRLAGGQRLARDLERVYRRMWRRHCAGLRP